MRRHAKAPAIRRRHVSRALVGALLCALFAVAGTSAPASAAVSRSLLETRTGAPGASAGPLTTDAAGDLYVQDYGNGQGIEKFGPAGTALDFGASQSYVSGNRLTGPASGSFFDNDPYGFGLYHGLAVNNATGPTHGYIYAMAAFANGGGAFVFDPSGTYAGFIPYAGGVAGEITFACDIAINQSSGDAFLTASSSNIEKRFTPLDGDPANDTLSGELQVESGTCATAIDSTGAIYASSAAGVVKYAGLSNPGPGTTIDPNTATALAVNPANDDVAVDLGNRVVEYDSVGNKVAEVGGLTSSEGVAYGTGGKLYASQTDGTVLVFGARAQLPIITTLPASELFPDAATLNGEVDPDSTGPIGKCEFRYGTDQSYGSGSVPCTASTPITSATQVSSPHLEGLERNTTYHYRLFAQGPNGAQRGEDLTFTTPPPVEGIATGEASEVTKETAKLNGSFVGRGEDHHYYFEYGIDTSYGQTAPAPPGNDAGSAKGQQELVPIKISGLESATEYHYRLVMTNAYGESQGEDRTFTTAPAVTNLSTEAATGITEQSVELNGSFDGDKYDVHYYFEYGPSESYGQTIPAPPGNDAGTDGGHVHVTPVEVTGLQEGGTYHYRIVASNEKGKTTSADATFKTAEKPSVANLSTANVTATAAELLGEINPQLGQTHYHFEWGPTTAYGNSVPVPDGDAGADRNQVQVVAQLEGLTAGVTYHFRLVASNQYGTTTSGDQTFGFYPPACPNAQVRQETGSNNLPDCRAYELASPANGQGTTIFPRNAPNTGLATNPARIAFGATFGTFPETGDPINSINDLYVSTRTDTGWYTKYIGRPANEALLMGGPPEGVIANLGLEQSPSTSQFGVATSPSMDRFADYDLGFPSDNYGQLGEPSNAPYVWNASTGALAERWPTNLSEVPGGSDFVGSPKVSAQFNHFVFSSNVVFAPGGEGFPNKIGCCEVGTSVEGTCCSAPVYDNNISTDQVSLISIKEDGIAFRGAPVDVSEDGSHILMSETADIPAGASRPLFLRVDDSRTYDIAGGKPVHYAGSSADGETVYFTSAEQLTADDHDESVDLFVWRESEPNSVTRVSVGASGEEGNHDDCSASWIEKCDVGLIALKRYSVRRESGSGQGIGNGSTDSPIASRSGDIYFESPEQLDGAKGDAGQVNMYLYRNGTVRYVTTMSPGTVCTEENSNGEECSTGPVARMQVTPDGSHAAFVSSNNLTSYDSGGHGEMYEYSPAAGRVVCDSCRPDGQPATSTVYGSQNGLYLTSDGRVFFSTRDSLVPRDTNGVNDVYEYVEGKPQLISAGLGASPEGFTGVIGSQTIAGLISVSANGTDVYFGTYDTLVTQDHNSTGELKIYDARTGGGFPADVNPPHCAAADECHGPGSVPPNLPPDHTSANLGQPKKPVAKHIKHKKHRKTHRKTKQRRAGKAKQRRHHV